MEKRWGRRLRDCQEARAVNAVAEAALSGKPVESPALDGVGDEEVQRVYDMINRRPRKCLGWKCPYEVFYGVSLRLA